MKYILPTSQFQMELEGFNEEIDSVFKNFYLKYINEHKVDWSTFWSAANIFFDYVESLDVKQSKSGEHDRFFNNFTPVWKLELENGNYLSALDVWTKVLKMTEIWERRTQGHVHKGTPYFFKAVTYIENFEIDLGFSLMYQGYLEDLYKNDNNESFESPGKSFITFDTDNLHNFYRNKLLQVKIYLRDNLFDRTNNQFKNFLEDVFNNPNIGILIKHQLQLNFFRIWKNQIFLEGSLDNAIKGLLNMESILGLSRLVEPILTGHIRTINNREMFGALCYTKKNVLTNSIRANNFRTIQFREQLSNILLKDFVLIDGKKHKLTKLTKNVLLTYGFRNLFHELHQEEFINRNILEILRAVIFTLHRASLELTK